METIWRNIEGYEDTYQVSNQGDIRRVDRDDRLLRKTKDTDGYSRISLCKNGVQKNFRVARLVAKSFPEICGEWFEGCQINHKNEKKNDDRAENLEICTPQYNCRYSAKSMKGRRKTEEYPVGMMKNDELLATFKSMRFAETITGIAYPLIRKCAIGQNQSAGGYQWRLL